MMHPGVHLVATVVVAFAFDVVITQIARFAHVFRR